MKKFSFIALLFISTHLIAADHLTGDELKAVLVGNTEAGVYTNDNGEKLDYWEFYHPDGVMGNTEAKYGVYRGTYTIKADGCLNADYDGDEYDGCYYYKHLIGDQYSVTSPRGTASTVTILKGDVKKWSRLYVPLYKVKNLPGHP